MTVAPKRPIPKGLRHGYCGKTHMPSPPETFSAALCPVTDPSLLTELYDNNASARNQADLKALQAASAAAFDSPTLMHERVVLGAADWAWVDVFKPRGLQAPQRLLPALLFLHGGRWQLNTSQQTSFWAQACCDAGYAFVGLNFPPLSATGLRLQVAAVAQALAGVRLHAHALGLDAGALALAGHSSGAHLALAALLRHPPAELPRALLLLGGIYDLAPLRLTAHQDSLCFSAEDATTCSPLQLLLRASPDSGLRLPPTLVAVGADESAEFLRQSRALHHALQPHTSARLLEVPGAAHFDAALAFNSPGLEVHRGPGLRMFISQALARDTP